MSPWFLLGIAVAYHRRSLSAQPRGLGHLAIQIASAMGFRVVALSSGPSKEPLALSLGAHNFIDGAAQDQGAALQALGGAKVVIETVQDAATIQKVMPGLAIEGTLLLIALEAAPIAVSPRE